MSRSRGEHPRHDPPKPPSTRPPRTGLDASRGGKSHEVYVEIASLQMAKARQQKIRDSLQRQVDSTDAQIEKIDQKIQALYKDAGLEAKNPDDRDASGPSQEGEDGFEYEY